jgi:hypothetical protein
MYILSVTVPGTKGTLVLQDEFPAEGTFVMIVPSGTTKSSSISDNQFGRIQACLDALVLQGSCSYTVTITTGDPLLGAISAGITIPPSAGTLSAKATGVNLRTLAGYTAVLPSSASTLFVPSRILVTATSATGIIGDAKIKIGTTVGGSDILPEAAVTGLTALNKTVIFIVIDDVPPIACNATLYITVTSIDSGTTAVATITIEGTEV